MRPHSRRDQGKRDFRYWPRSGSHSQGRSLFSVNPCKPARKGNRSAIERCAVNPDGGGIRWRLELSVWQPRFRKKAYTEHEFKGVLALVRQEMTLDDIRFGGVGGLRDNLVANKLE